MIMARYGPGSGAPSAPEGSQVEVDRPIGRPEDRAGAPTAVAQTSDTRTADAPTNDAPTTDFPKTGVPRTGPTRAGHPGAGHPAAGSPADSPAQAASEPTRDQPPGSDSASARTRRIVLGAFGFAVLLSLLAFHDAWLGMVQVWRNSETFTHGFIALPFAAWMIWSKRREWSQRPLATWWPGLAVLAACGGVWIVGRLAGVSSVEQIGAVAVIPATLAALVGPPITRSLAFPLAFLFFAVPIGEFLTPKMMDYTADATVLALQWTGIPVYREGLFFTVPSGRWSVVEACSGLRYLIASLALGVLYAYLQFRTLKFRLMFIALAAIVPIIANWIRAYLIVMIGHLSDMRLAVGADHLIYGWIFFGIVMGLLFWVGSRMREPAPAPEGVSGAVARAELVSGQPLAGSHASPASPFAPTRSAPATGKRLAVAASALAIALLARPISAALFGETEPVAVGSLVSTALGGSLIELEPPSRLGGTPRPQRWAPVYRNATESVQGLVEIEGRPVEVHLFYYARQHEGQEMIHNDHRVVDAGSQYWPVRARGKRSTPWGEVAEYRIGHSAVGQLLLWHWYEVAGRATRSEYVAKALTALSLLQGDGDHSLAIVLAAPLRSDRPEELERARRALETTGRRLSPVTDALSRGEGTRR